MDIVGEPGRSGLRWNRSAVRKTWQAGEAQLEERLRRRRATARGLAPDSAIWVVPVEVWLEPGADRPERRRGARLLDRRPLRLVEPHGDLGQWQGRHLRGHRQRQALAHVAVAQDAAQAVHDLVIGGPA